MTVRSHRLSAAVDRAASTIEAARATYRAIRDRCLAVEPDQAGFINSLWEAWDRELAAFGDATVVPWYVAELGPAATDPALSDGAVLHWLDAYPDAIDFELRSAQ